MAMGKRKRGDKDEDRDDDDSQSKEHGLPSEIRNKDRRAAAYAKQKSEKKQEKKKVQKARLAAEKEAYELGEVPPPRQIPRTIENTREPDETIAHPDDDELHADDAADEFSAHFAHLRTSKLLITTSQECSNPTRKFILDLLKVIPHAHYYKRGSYELKEIVKYANNQEFTGMMVINENHKAPNGMLIVNLPEGPTAHFKISNLVLSKKIKNHGRPTSHLPELILNNFTTRLGHRIGRLFASIFPQNPNFKGRRSVTFHNQRDFIFFRHHRYIFESKEVKEPITKKAKLEGDLKKRKTKQSVIARLQELGPRFTLKLQSLQHGTFDSKFGEYEWLHKADMDTSRRRFFL